MSQHVVYHGYGVGIIMKTFWLSVVDWVVDKWYDFLEVLAICLVVAGVLACMFGLLHVVEKRACARVWQNSGYTTVYRWGCVVVMPDGTEIPAGALKKELP